MKSSATPEADYDPISVTVENLGGIDVAEVTLEPGVNVLSGRNATNRTSLLKSLGGVLGGTTALLKSDRDNGHIEMEYGGDLYRREYSRTTSGVDVSDSPYANQEVLVDFYVALFEGNPAREAVERGDDLREVIMRPVDTDKIQTKIADLKQNRKEIENELDRVSNARAELPSLEEKQRELKGEIEQIDDQIANLRSEVADHEADLEAAEEAADIVDELDDHRQELNSLEDEIEVKQAERDALEDDLADIESDLDELPEDVSNRLSDVQDRLQTAQQEKNELDETIASLTTIVDFNDDLLSEGVNLPGLETNENNIASGLTPTDQQEVVCWTCGSQVPRGEIIDRLDDLRNIIEEKRNKRGEIADQIDNLQSKKQELKSFDRKRTSLERRLTETKERIDEREQTLETLEDDREALKGDIADLEQRVAKTEEVRETDLLEKYERISELQYERGQLQQQLDDCEGEIDRISSLPDEDELEAQLDAVQKELETERTRVGELEAEAVEKFNEHMAELLELLDYENIARIWIERKQQSERGTSMSQASFDLHIVRETTDGTGYEDEVETLSESEREVVGLVVALAGNLVHGVHEEIPFILLDSLEAIDAQRIDNLVEYFSTYVPNLVIALLPEDAAALRGEYSVVTADTLAV